VGHRQPHRGHPLADRLAAGAPHREPRDRRRREPLLRPRRTLACGYLGIKNKIAPSAECKGDAYLGEYQLPRSLGEALQLLRDETDLHEVLGKDFVTVYTEIKEIEHAEFMKVISPWEREHLLLHV
jgi:Glutamine synthetase